MAMPINAFVWGMSQHKRKSTETLIQNYQRNIPHFWSTPLKSDAPIQRGGALVRFVLVSASNRARTDGRTGRSACTSDAAAVRRSVPRHADAADAAAGCRGLLAIGLASLSPDGRTTTVRLNGRT